MVDAPTPSTQPISPYALSGVFLALCLFGVLMAPGVNYSDFARESIAEVGALGLLVYWLYRNRRVTHITLTLSATRGWLGGLLLAATLSVLWAENIPFFLSKYLLWVGAAAVFWLTLTLPPNTRTHILLARGLILAATYVALLGLIQTFFEVSPFSQATPPAATFVNKNVAAQVMVLLFPLGLFLFAVDTHRYLAKLYPAIIAVMAAYLFHTQARAAWVGFALELLVIAVGLIFCRRGLRAAVREGSLAWGAKQTLGALFALVLFLLLISWSAQGFLPFWSLFATEVSGIYREAQSYGQIVRESVRYRLWDSALIMLADNPLIGSGMGSFFHNLLTHPEKYRAHIEMRAHNDLLELGVELGLLGWVLFAGAVGGLLANLGKLITRGSLQQRLLYLAIAAALGGSALNMQFSFPYQLPVPPMIFGLYAALIVKAGDHYNPRLKVIRGALLKPWKVALGAGVVFALVLVMNVAWLGAVFQVSDNIKSGRWVNPIAANRLNCHKTLVKTLYDFSAIYTGRGEYRTSLGVLASFSRCVPDTWVAENARGWNLVKLKQYDQAVALFERAKRHAPAGAYQHYINHTFVALEMGDLPGAEKVYRELSAHPEKLLATRPMILRQITLLALQFNHPETAEKFHRLYRKHYGKNAKFESQVNVMKARSE